MKPKALFILHISPPVHGSAIVGEQIKNSKLIASDFNSAFINLNTSTSIDNIGALTIKKIFLFIKITIQIIAKLIYNKYNIIYMAPTVSKGGAIKDGIIIFFINLLKKNSTIFLHLHNKGVSVKHSQLWKIWYRMFFRKKKIIILAERLYKDISDYVAYEDVYVCPNGINEVKNTNKKYNKIINILFLSNLIREKGIVDLLDACAILKSKKFFFSCNVVGGEGDICEEELLKMIDDRGLGAKVFYLGKKYGIEKIEVFEKSDIFCFPTYYHNETFGIVNIEAMQFSLPVISTNIGGIPDIIDDGINGFIVETKSPEQIAHKISYFIENPTEIIRMGENGHKKFLKNYTDEIFEKRLLEILNT